MLQETRSCLHFVVAFIFLYTESSWKSIHVLALLLCRILWLAPEKKKVYIVKYILFSYIFFYSRLEFPLVLFCLYICIYIFSIGQIT